MLCAVITSVRHWFSCSAFCIPGLRRSDHSPKAPPVPQPVLNAHCLRRYTSYGRHFTQPEYLKEVNRRLMPFVRPGDTIVDFSCGENTWMPMLKEMCLRDGWVMSLPGPAANKQSLM